MISAKKIKKRWFNIWEEIYKHGVPSDLMNPYGKFNLILDKIIDNNCKNVLDVAMGTGRHAIILARSGLEVYGFDLSDTALRFSTREAKKRKLKIHIKKADMFNTYPYKDNFFDAVVATQAIYHGYKRHMQKAIHEINRILKPKGVFCFTVSTDKTRAGKGSKNNPLNLVAPRTYIPLSGREKGVPHFYPTSDELLKMLKGQFTDIDIMVDEINRYLLVTCKNKK